MGFDSRWRVLKVNSLWLYTAELIPRLGSLLIVPIWSSLVRPGEYAHWILAATSIELLMATGNMGLVSFMVKVLYRYHDERADRYFSMAFKIVLLATVALAILVSCFSPWLSR